MRTPKRKDPSWVRGSSLARSRYEEMGVSVPLYVTNRKEKMLAAIRSELDEAAFRTAWEEGRALSADEAVALALAIHDSQ